MLRRALALMLFVCAAWPAASARPAGGAPGAFKVAVQGSQQTVVTRVRRSTNDLGCLVTWNDLDRQTQSFTTQRPGRLAMSSARRPGRAHVVVRVQSVGSRLRRSSVAGESPACETAPQTTETGCGPVAMSGQAIVRIPAPGTIHVSGSLERVADNARCAPTAAAGSPFLVGWEGTFRARFLTDPKIERVVLRGTAERTDNLPAGARRVTTVRWTVVLTRTD